MFNNLSTEEYIKEVVIPGVMPLVDRNINTVIWDINGYFVFASNSFARGLGFASWKDLEGKFSGALTRDSYPILKNAPDLALDAANQIIAKLHELKDKVIETGLPISAILIHPFHRLYRSARLNHYIPIFHPNGKVIAIQLFGESFRLFGLRDYLSNYTNQSYSNEHIIKSNSDLPIALSKRQHEIVFLLAIGLTQREAAEILQITRGTLAKVAAEVICPKFDIFDGNTTIMIEKARELNFHNLIPVSLCRPWVIVVNEDKFNN